MILKDWINSTANDFLVGYRDSSELSAISTNDALKFLIKHFKYSQAQAIIKVNQVREFHGLPELQVQNVLWSQVINSRYSEKCGTVEEALEEIKRLPAIQRSHRILRKRHTVGHGKRLAEGRYQRLDLFEKRIARLRGSYKRMGAEELMEVVKG